MRKPGLATIGFGLIGIGSTLFATPASAAIDCGTAPTGGTLTQSGDYCQLRFQTGGDYTFTVPTSANQLFALVVGGGAGATINSNNEGYAGSAGKVHYKDMTDSIGESLSIHIGAGGTGGSDSANTSGNDSSVSSPSTSNYAVSWGAQGTQTSTSTWCTVTNWVGAISVGEGARTQSALSSNGNMCVNGQGAGVNPASNDVDSDAAARPAIFNDLNESFGIGGRIVISPSTIPAINFGDGGSFRVDATSGQFVGNPGNGGGGLAILRWRKVLANTGSNAGDLSALAISLMTLGAGLTVASRMRRRASK